MSKYARLDPGNPVDDTGPADDTGTGNTGPGNTGPDFKTAAIVADIASRKRSRAHVIAVANEKGGVGKSTIAFHAAIALGHQGARVAVVDLDPRQQTLNRALLNREATIRRLGLELPEPRRTVLQMHNVTHLCQEVARVGWEYDYVLMDVAGYDSPIARHVVALADTLITPVSNSFVDLDLLGFFDAVSLKYQSPGPFAQLVCELRDERTKAGLPALDWVVVQNRVRRSASHNESRITAALAQLPDQIGCRLGTGLTERVAYRELFLLGLTHYDLRHIPGIGRGRADARREVSRLVEMLNLPQPVSEPDYLYTRAPVEKKKPRPMVERVQF